MTRQSFSFNIQREMPTEGGSSDPDDFMSIPDGGILNGKPPALFPATEYPAGTDGDNRDAIVKSGDNYTVYIQEQSQGIPIEFKIRPAGFQFKLTRDDGTIIDSAEYEWATIFSCRNASGQNFAPEDVTYDDDPDSSMYQYWSFKIPEFARDKDGYWVRFSYVDDSVNTVYPYRYKTAEQYQEADLIKPGKYEAAVPYWKTEFSNTGILFAPPPDFPETWWPDTGCARGGYTNTPVIKTCTVHSSIPYTVTFYAKDAPNGAYYGKYNPQSCRLEFCEYCLEIAWEHWFCDKISEDVTVTSSNGDSSENIETDPILSTKIITPPEHTVQTDSGNMTFAYSGGDYEMVKHCGGIYSEETITMIISFKYFKFNGNVYAFPNT